MKVLIPMAGEGSRFAKAGYRNPKPLVEVDGKTMIQTVIENLKFEAEYIFLVRSEHLKNYPLENIIAASVPKYKIIVVDKLTEGAACTALLAKDYINDGDSLLIANSDQYIDFSMENFDLLRRYSNVDGIILTFKDTDPKWSFVAQDATGKITRVAEKNPISDIATCGVYFYRKGSDFVRYAEQMIQQNDRVNNEFYIAPVYNYFIRDSKMIVPFFVTRMWGLGTPEDLNYFLKFKK